MKVIRWLFSNIILIAFVLALTYAYVYWDNLTGEDTPAGKLIAYLSLEYDEVRELLDDYNLGAENAAKPGPAPAVSETASVPQVSPFRQQMPSPAQQPVPPQAMMQQPPTMMQQPPARQRQYSRSPFMDQAMTEPSARQPFRPRYPEPSVRQERPAMPQMPPVPPRRESMSLPAQREPAPMPMPMPMPMTRPGDQGLTVEQPVSSTRELWISAREEYHRGNIDVSIRNYKEVIATSADNYDAYGELGNVYLSRGSDKEAASAYFEAAAILVKIGLVGRASSLLPMLDRLDRSKAEELNQLISHASS